MNKYGLKRYIPESVQKEVRMRCGFGCVVCGSMFYDYEHFDPAFEECQSHNANGITLLCGRHHANKTRDFFPLSAVRKANANPYAKSRGFWEDLTFDSTPPVILLGNNETRHYRDIIIINNKSVLRVDPPECPESPYLITACFCDAKGDNILNIEKNVLKGDVDGVDNFDIKVSGGIITINSLEKNLNPLLKISLKNQPFQFEVAEMNMFYEGNKVVVDKEGQLRVKNSIGGGITMNKSKATTEILADAFCIKIHSCGRIEGFGYN